MKKFSVLIIVCAIILTVALLAYNRAVSETVVAEENYSLYSEILENSNTDFKNKAIAFTPFTAKITDGDEKAYVDSLMASSDKIQGCLAPSALYYVSTPVSGGNAYVAQDGFFENCFKDIDSEGFNYAPVSADEVTVVLGSAYKDNFKSGGKISLRIRGEDETFTVNAEITDIMEADSFDPVNQIVTSYGVYVGDLTAVVGDEARHDSQERVYTVIYSGDVKDVVSVLSDYGFADSSFNYYLNPETAAASYKTMSDYSRPFAVASALCMAAAFGVFACAVFFNLKKSDSQIFSKTVASLIFTVIVAVIYVAISFGKIAIPSVILTLVPYIFMLAVLTGICIAGSFKKEKA